MPTPTLAKFEVVLTVPRTGERISTGVLAASRQDAVTKARKAVIARKGFGPGASLHLASLRPVVETGLAHPHDKVSDDAFVPGGDFDQFVAAAGSDVFV